MKIKCLALAACAAAAVVVDASQGMRNAAGCCAECGGAAPMRVDIAPNGHCLHARLLQRCISGRVPVEFGSGGLRSICLLMQILAGRRALRSSSPAMYGR